MVRMKLVLKIGLVVAAVVGFGVLLVNADVGRPAKGLEITEPASLLLLGTGVAAVATIFRRLLKSRNLK